MIPVLQQPRQKRADSVRLSSKGLEFDLPAELEAGEPPEARGLARDQVRLMVSDLHRERILHTNFSHLPEHVQPGDLMVINTSGTLNAALNVQRADGTPLELHLSTRLPAELWIVELRRSNGAWTEPFYKAKEGERLFLPGDGLATLHVPYDPGLRGSRTGKGQPARLWLASLELPGSPEAYLETHGFPIRYKYVRRGWPSDYYQTVYATEKGSAEMPSAGRAFSPELITRLVAKGVMIAPLLLHTGVASLESHELPHEEYYRVSPETARAVNQARRAGKRVIAVGTTSVRALETLTDEAGIVSPGEGWTRLVITPESGLRSVDALLTGFHEPKASHLSMLAALAGFDHLKQAYQEALAAGYLWHEFGDMHLILR